MPRSNKKKFPQKPPTKHPPNQPSPQNKLCDEFLSSSDRFTRSGKSQAIHSAAETELGRQMTKEEDSSLSTKFSLNDVYNNLQKVKDFYRL